MVKRAAVLVLALAAAACEKLATRQFADFSQAAVAARIEALRSDVESVLGDTIGPITVKVVTAKELAKVIAPQLEEFRANDEGGARGAALKEQCERDAELQSMTLLGMVGAKTGWVYICPENFELPADRGRDARTYRSQPCLDVILVHEMTHVWQHHRDVLPRAIGATRDHEEQVARAAVLEGHAEFISRAVADHRGIRDTFDLHLRMLTVPSSSTEDEASLHRERLFLAHLSFRYVQGLRLWDEVVAALGRPAAQERLFAHPPKSVLAVERENEYLHPSPKPAFDLDLATRLVRRYLGERMDAPTSIVSVLPSALKISLDSVGVQGRRAVEGMVRGHSINAPKLSVALILCRSHAAARALQEASIADTRTKGKTDNKFSLSITSDESIEVEGVDAHLINVTVNFNDRPVHMWQAFFTDGLVWVEVGAHDTDRDSMLRLIPRIAALLAKPPWKGQTTTEAIATMRTSLKHDDWRIRWRAVRNLGRLLEEQPDLKTQVRQALKDKQPGVRLAALRALSKTEAPVPDMARDPDWEVRVEFCSKLALDERTPKPQRVTRLIALLRDDSVRVQAVACTAIADLDAASQVPFDTIAKLYASKDRLVRRAAISLFPYISHSDKRAGMLLVRALDDPDSRVRFDAAFRVGRYDAVVAESLPKLIRLLRDESVDVRVIALHAIGNIGTQAGDAVPHILPLLDDPILRSAAVGALRDMKQAAKPARARLVRALRSKDRGFAFAAAEALWAMGHNRKRLLPIVVETLRDGEGYDRQTAAACLAEVGVLARPYLADLAALLQSTDTELAFAVARALWELDYDRKPLLPAIVATIRSHSDYAYEAVEYLGKMGDLAHPYIRDIIGALSAEDEMLVSNAAAALGRLGPAAKEALPALRKLLANEDIRWDAEDAIEKIDR